MRFQRMWPLVALVLIVGGCYPLTIDATGLDADLYMTPAAASRVDAQPVGDVEAEVTGSWLLWGLLTLNEPDITEAVRREVTRAGGSGVVNLSLTTQRTFIDGLLSAITLGIYGQRTVFVEGTAVRAGGMNDGVQAGDGDALQSQEAVR